MECYETCADRGKRCVLSREKISCGKCGKIRPCYNIQSIPCGLCPPTEPCNCPKQEKEKYGQRRDQTCKCTQTCWQWILSFLGFGEDMPECCRNIQLTAWQSGEVARQALVSKVQSVVSLVSGKEQSPVVALSPIVEHRTEVSKTDKKATEFSPRTDKESTSQDISDTSPEQTSVKENITQTANEKKGKVHKSRSRSSHRKGKHRKGGSAKSRSISREKQDERKVLGKLRSASTSSTSVSQGRKHRSKSRSRSRSRASVKIYNPFKTKQSSFKCPSPCTAKPAYSPIICPPYSPLSPRCLLGQINESQAPYFSRKHVSPSCQNMQTTSAKDRTGQIRRSHSTSYKPYQTTSKTVMETSYRCPPIPLCSRPKPPCLSRSFHSTPPMHLSTPCKHSPQSSVCLPTKTPRACAPTLGQRALSCLCYTDYSKMCSSCHRTCCCAVKSRNVQPRSACCKNLYPNLKPTCCCSSVSKYSVGACHSYCTKSCCLSLPRRPSAHLFLDEGSPHQQYQSPPQSSVNRSYVCSAGAGCCCPTQSVSPTARSGCFANTCTTGYPSSISASYKQANQDSAICQQLLSKYGYSPPVFPPCPLTCYGSASEAICSSLSCAPFCFCCPHICGCNACRSSSGQHNLPRLCEFRKNLTNSRKPRSPGGSCCGKQIIEFNSSPCDRKPKHEFQLPPHCIRETGPRSPVGEYLALLRVPKPARSSPGQEEKSFDKLMEASAKAPDSTAPETVTKVAEASVKAPEDQTQESSANAPADSVNILEANAKSKIESDKAKPGKKRTMKQSRKTMRRSSENRNASASNNWRNENKEDINQYQVHITRNDYPSGEFVLLDAGVSSDSSCRPEIEGSCNNNYGGDSYRFSSYSSAGPVLTDFSELTSHSNRYSDVLAHSSASSGYVPRYTVYNTGSSNFHTRGITNYTTKNYNGEASQFRETSQFESRWYTPKASRNVNINAQKQRTDFRHTTAYNRSLNSQVTEVSDSLKSSKYLIQLETAIENKIKELRQSRAFSSPPARKRLVDNLHLEPRTRHGTDSFQSTDSFIRESWDTLNKRAERRRKDLMSSNNFSIFNSEVKSFLIDEQPKQPPIKHQINEDNDNGEAAKITRGHQKHNSTIVRENKTHIENKLPREASKKKYEVFNKTRTQSWKMENINIFKDEKINRYFTEYKNSSVFTEDKNSSVLKEENNKCVPKERKAPMRHATLLETSEKSEEKPTRKIDCAPVLQDIIESFEETVELLIHSHKMDSSADAVQPQEAGVFVTAVTKDKQESVRNIVQSVDTEQLKEENQSSNKLDKHTLATVSSPPQKPFMIKSQEEQVSGGRAQTCSCRSNSRATTSTVSLEISHCLHSAASSPSISESEDTSLTFSKLSQASRTDLQPTREDFNKHQASASTIMPNYLSENKRFPLDTRVDSKAALAQPQGKTCVAMTPSRVRGAVSVEGSSVDPFNSTLSDNASKLTVTSSDKVNEIYQFENTPITHVGVYSYQNSMPEGGDTMCNSNMKADNCVTSNCPSSPALHRPLDELMRQFIRENGTPV